MARPHRCLLSKRLMIWLSSNEGVKRLSGMESRECRTPPGYLSSASLGTGQKVSVLFAETSHWHDSQRMDACQDFYLPSPRGGDMLSREGMARLSIVLEILAGFRDRMFSSDPWALAQRGGPAR